MITETVQARSGWPAGLGWAASAVDSLCGTAVATFSTHRLLISYRQKGKQLPGRAR